MRACKVAMRRHTSFAPVLEIDNPSSSTHSLVAELKRCSRAKDIEAGMKAHADAIKRGCYMNLFVANTLVDMYSKCGRMKEAKQVFDSMPQRCIISWTALILGFVQSGESRLALQLFHEMQHSPNNIRPDNRTLYAVLGACLEMVKNQQDPAEDSSDDRASQELKRWCLEECRRIHSLVVNDDAFVVSMLINVYSACGSVLETEAVFRSQKTLLSPLPFTAMINAYSTFDKPGESLNLYRFMLNSGVTPDARTLIAVLKACSGSSSMDRELNSSIHSQVVESGFLNRDEYLMNTLLDSYVKCGSLQQARELFDSLDHPCLACWNSIIMGYAQRGKHRESLELFSEMKKCRKEEPDARTFVAVLKACSAVAGDQNALESGRSIHRELEGVHRWDFTRNNFVCNALVDMYSKFGRTGEAREVFDRIAHPNTSCWNTIIFGYVDNSEPSPAMELYSRMNHPDARTHVAALKACSMGIGSSRDEQEQAFWIEKGRLIHQKLGRKPLDMHQASVLVDFYSRCSRMDEARALFDSMPLKSTVVWNSLITGYANGGTARYAAEVLPLFATMRLVEGTPADGVTFSGVLKSCAKLGSLDRGREIHSELEHIAIESEAEGIVAASLIHMYASCGSMSEAESVFSKYRGGIQACRAVLWNALIGGYAHQGDAGCAFAAFEEMKRSSVRPDGITFVSLLSCCSHAGLVEKGMEFFKSMGRLHGVSPGVFHYGCVVDLLGRSNRLEEALQLVSEMPLPASSDIWLTILSACSKWGNLEVGKLAFERVLELNSEPDSAAYLLLNAIYARHHLPPPFKQ